MAAVIRAFLATSSLYLSSELSVEPGKQLAPFEFVLVFFYGWFGLTAMVGNEVSFTNAICQIMAIGLAHYLLAWIRSKSPRFARLTDGTPLVLLQDGQW
jgi:uncharacterized membrane protein YcaP (DUF421 family)